MDEQNGNPRVNLLLELIRSILRDRPGLTKKEIKAEMTLRAPELSLNLSTSELNSKYLYHFKDIFRPSADSLPRWYLSDSLIPILESIQTSTSSAPKEFHVPGLRPWQQCALDAWVSNNRRGIVEAVTGSGKTMLAIAAVADQLTLGGRVAVVVPTIELQTQWKREVEKFFPEVEVALMGNGHTGSLADHKILIAILKSASTRQLGLAEGASGLLVADECHRFGSDVYQLALEEGFEARLGLSATRERSDGAHETVLEPYFGPVVYSLGYKDAIAAGCVAHIRVALIGVNLSASERDEYDVLSEQISALTGELINKFGAPAPDPYVNFIAVVSSMSKNGTMREGITANRYLSAVSKRRSLLCETGAKLDVLDLLVESIHNSNGTLIFTETITGATEAMKRLRLKGVNATVMHSKLSTSERRLVFDSFSNGTVEAIVAPRLLDEGIDVPEADFAVILASSRTQRQMIQRMGRVIRPKSDGRVARFAITYIFDTSEDPREGAHEAFLTEILEIADDSSNFTSASTAQELTTFLSP